MMRFLGWGIGHRNPHDFPHEANALLASREDRELVQYEDTTLMDGSQANSGEGVDNGGVNHDDMDVDFESGDDNHGDVDADSESGDQPLDVYQY